MRCFTFCLGAPKLKPIKLFTLCVGDLPQGVRGGPVRRLGEHEPGPIRCSQHTIWDKIWIRSQGWLFFLLVNVQILYLKPSDLYKDSLLINPRSFWQEIRPFLIYSTARGHPVGRSDWPACQNPNGHHSRKPGREIPDHTRRLWQLCTPDATKVEGR